MNALALLLCSGVLAAPAPKAPRNVHFFTKDGLTIAANYRPPRKGFAVLILAHGVGSSKGEWEAFTARLAAQGVGALAVDLRKTDDWPKAVEDLRAACGWLKARGVPESRIALGGASVGANLAAWAAAERPKTPFLLLLSPGPDYRGVQLVRPRTKTLAVAAAEDGYAHSTLPPLAAIPQAATFEAPHGHGVQMFADPATLDRVVAWVAAAAKP